MVIFTIKLLKNIRTAVAGRKHPHQLAWAIAFGVLLGIVPHGNLLALAILILVLSLQINHAMAAVAAIGTTLLATRLDPLSDQVGNYVLSHEKFGPMMADAWQMPLVPWTNLNNTVVMGSFLIGVVALVPIFLITYPLLRVFAPKDDLSQGESEQAAAEPEAEQVIYVDRPHAPATSHLVDHPAAAKESVSVARATTKKDHQREASVDQYLASLSDADTAAPKRQTDTLKETTEKRVTVETRIDVIRMKDHREQTTSSASPANSTAATANPRVLSSDSIATDVDTAEQTETEKPLDEALNYLLRQLRDSQQRKAG